MSEKEIEITINEAEAKNIVLELDKALDEYRKTEIRKLFPNIYELYVGLKLKIGGKYGNVQ